MSETTAISPAHTPTVYFIDDSATMREVIKIAFRREKINVITCQDVDSAVAQFEQASPDAVISDVIMPGKDGYECCQLIKQHPRLNSVPVILMSGVVNREVAERAMAVKADELVRKPFQPQELIARVKHLLSPGSAAAACEAPTAAAAQALSSLFAEGAAQSAAALPAAARALVRAALPASVPARAGEPSASAALQRLRSEVLRLELLVKKLQSELEAERQYSRALEAHVKTLQESK